MEIYPKRYEIDVIEDSKEPYSYLVEDCDGDWVLWEDYEKLLDFAVRAMIRHTLGNYSVGKVRSVILEALKDHDSGSDS